MSYTELESGYQGLKQASSSDGTGSALQTPSGRPGFYVGDESMLSRFEHCNHIPTKPAQLRQTPWVGGTVSYHHSSGGAIKNQPTCVVFVGVVSRFWGKHRARLLNCHRGVELATWAVGRVRLHDDDDDGGRALNGTLPSSADLLTRRPLQPFLLLPGPLAAV
ncbi:Dpse\GA13115-PA-like protein [Anopheles sinensis]|uniref:Dpse\GA13115-PA-like protein n=1 Tax=Anopheles sinensis TaxID=74873 RepID=A0A084VQE3_ANOSI|nr:Dpse\GA13115-PA-like protein [Anopheles sinensis]